MYINRLPHMCSVPGAHTHAGHDTRTHAHTHTHTHTHTCMHTHTHTHTHTQDAISSLIQSLPLCTQPPGVSKERIEEFAFFILNESCTTVTNTAAKNTVQLVFGKANLVCVCVFVCVCVCVYILSYQRRTVCTV